jgi:hypothetical protein
VNEALEALEAGNNGRFAEIVEEAKEREHSSGQSRALRLQKKLASKAAKSETGRSVVNSTLGETGAVVLDVILQIVQSLLSAEDYSELEVKLYTGKQRMLWRGGGGKACAYSPRSVLLF